MTNAARPDAGAAPRPGDAAPATRSRRAPPTSACSTRGARRTGSSKDAWRALRILSEFVEGFDTPRRPAAGGQRVRLGPDQAGSRRSAQLAEQLGAALARAGYAVITGGGPGVMEAANKGATEAGGLSVGLGIELPFEQGLNDWFDIGIDFRYFFARKTMFVKYAQAFVRAARRLRHDGRAVRGADAGADRQGDPVPGRADGHGVLAGPDRLDARHDGGRAARSARPISTCSA